MKNQLDAGLSTVQETEMDTSTNVTPADSTTSMLPWCRSMDIDIRIANYKVLPLPLKTEIVNKIDNIPVAGGGEVCTSSSVETISVSEQGMDDWVPSADFKTSIVDRSGKSEYHDHEDNGKADFVQKIVPATSRESLETLRPSISDDLLQSHEDILVPMDTAFSDPEILLDKHPDTILSQTDDGVQSALDTTPSIVAVNADAPRNSRSSICVAPSLITRFDSRELNLVDDIANRSMIPASNEPIVDGNTVWQSASMNGNFTPVVSATSSASSVETENELDNKQNIQEILSSFTRKSSTASAVGDILTSKSSLCSSKSQCSDKDTPISRKSSKSHAVLELPVEAENSPRSEILLEEDAEGIASSRKSSGSDLVSICSAASYHSAQAETLFRRPSTSSVITAAIPSTPRKLSESTAIAKPARNSSAISRKSSGSDLSLCSAASYLSMRESLISRKPSEPVALTETTVTNKTVLRKSSNTSAQIRRKDAVISRKSSSSDLESLCSMNSYQSMEETILSRKSSRSTAVVKMTAVSECVSRKPSKSVIIAEAAKSSAEASQKSSSSELTSLCSRSSSRRMKGAVISFESAKLTSVEQYAEFSEPEPEQRSRCGDITENTVDNFAVSRTPSTSDLNSEVSSVMNALISVEIPDIADIDSITSSQSSSTVISTARVVFSEPPTDDEELNSGGDATAQIEMLAEVDLKRTGEQVERFDPEPVKDVVEIHCWWKLMSRGAKFPLHHVRVEVGQGAVKIKFLIAQLEDVTFPLTDIRVKVPMSRKLWRSYSHRRLVLSNEEEEVKLIASFHSDRDRLIKRIARYWREQMVSRQKEAA